MRKCDLIYGHKKIMAFPVSILAKLINDEQNCVQNSYIEFH